MKQQAEFLTDNEDMLGIKKTSIFFYRNWKNCSYGTSYDITDNVIVGMNFIVVTEFIQIKLEGFLQSARWIHLKR